MSPRSRLDGSIVAGGIVVFGGGIALTVGWPGSAALFPRLICGLGLALSLLAGLRLLWRPDADGDVVADAGDVRRQLAVVAWVAGFYLAVWMLGFQYGLPLVMAVYYKTTARLSLWATLAVVAVAAGFIWLAQDRLHLALYPGLLLSW